MLTILPHPGEQWRSMLLHDFQISINLAITYSKQDDGVSHTEKLLGNNSHFHLNWHPNPDKIKSINLQQASSSLNHAQVDLKFPGNESVGRMYFDIAQAQLKCYCYAFGGRKMK